jgi:anti-sigma regulatory factor (Ser/Thr protein kinase)
MTTLPQQLELSNLAMPSQRFTCSLQNLEKIYDYVTAYAKQAGLNESEIYAVQLAVDEASTNIMEHGYGRECPNRIDITCEILKNGLKVMIYDDADPFDPVSVPQPELNVSLDEVKPRGLGIFLMRKMMDEVSYQPSSEIGNTLTMIKYHSK